MTRDIKAYLSREIHELENEIIEYKSKMDQCLEFGQQYWRYRDKYQSSLIRKSCFADLLFVIESGYSNDEKKE